MKKIVYVLILILLFVSCDSNSVNQGSSNTADLEGRVKAPKIVLQSDSTADGKNIISLSSSTFGSDIYYTLDSSLPTKTNGLKYNHSQKIKVDSATTVRAVAIMEGMGDSSVSSASFTQVSTPDYSLLNTGKLKLSNYDSSLKYYYTTSNVLDTSEMTECGEVFLPAGTGNVTVKVVACKAGYINSRPQEHVFPVSSSPVLTVIGDSYGNRKYVDISFDSSSKFYYTISDFYPTIGGEGTYQIFEPGTFEFSKKTLISAQCFEEGKLLSDVARCYIYED